MTTMDDVLNMIRMGIQVKKFFPYDGTEIPIRAISTAEFDDAKNKSVDICDEKLAQQILKLRLGIIKQKIETKNIPIDMFKNYLRYMQEFDFWVVYHGMKDYRDSTFTIEDVRKMRYIHEMAQTIIDCSSLPEPFMKYVIATPDGQKMATLIWEIHVPLVSELWKLTPLQEMFLEGTNPNKMEKVETMEDLNKILAVMAKK